MKTRVEAASSEERSHDSAASDVGVVDITAAAHDNGFPDCQTVYRKRGTRCLIIVLKLSPEGI